MPPLTRNFLLLAAVIPTTLGIVGFVAARFAFPGQETVLAILIVLTMALIGLAIWHGALALLSRQFAGQPTLLDRASIEPMVALFLIPITTALTGLAVNFAVPFANLIRDQRPDANFPASLLAVEIIVTAMVFALLVPLIALHKVVEARHGRGVALFDPDISDQVFDDALLARWRRLRDVRRHWLTSDREAAFGNEEGSARVAWPTQTTYLPRRQTKWLSCFPWPTAGVAIACISIVSAGWLPRPVNALPDPNLSTIAIACGLAPASLSALVIWLYVYRRLLREQSEANLLRLAASSRPKTPQHEPPLTLAQRWSLLRQAFSRSPSNLDRHDDQPRPERRPMGG